MISAAFLCVLDYMALPWVAAIRVNEGVVRVVLITVMSIKDSVIFDAERFSLFLKPVAQEVENLWRIICKSANLVALTLCFPFSLVALFGSMSGKLVQPALPAVVVSSIAIVLLMGEKTKHEIISMVESFYQCVADATSYFCARLLWFAHAPEEENIPPNTSFSLSRYGSPASLLRDSYKRKTLIKIRERIETASTFYRLVDNGTAAMERILRDHIRHGVEKVANRVGSLGDIWSRQLIETRVRNWEIRCPESRTEDNMNTSGKIDGRKRRTLTFSKAISQPQKASNSTLYEPYNMLRVSFYRGYWKPIAPVVNEQQSDHEEQAYTSAEVSTSTISCHRFAPISETTTTTKEGIHSVRTCGTIISPSYSLKDPDEAFRQQFHSGAETSTAWQGRNVISSLSGTPFSSPSTSRKAPISPHHSTQALIDEKKGSSRSHYQFLSSRRQAGIPQIGAFSPLFPFIRLAMNNTAVYRTLPARMYSEGDSDYFEWNMSFTLECRHPLDQFSLTILDYDYVTDNSEIVSILTIPVWRIPKTKYPLKGWLPVWIGPHEIPSPTSGILWLHMELQMKCSRIDLEFMALLLPLPKLNGKENCSPKTKPSTDTRLLPTSAEICLYRVVENGLQRFAFRRDSWSKESNTKSKQHLANSSLVSSDVLGQLLKSHLHLQREIWTLIGTPILSTIMAVLKWRYPIVSIAALLSFWWIWMQPSFILPTSVGLLGLTYAVQYFCLIEGWNVFAYPFSTLLKFMIKWNEDDEDNEMKMKNVQEGINSCSNVSTVHPSSRENFSLPEFTPSYTTKSNSVEVPNLSQIYSYKTKMISHLLPLSVKVFLCNFAVLCERCADTVEKANKWNITRSRPLTLILGFIGVASGLYFCIITQDWTIAAPELVVKVAFMTVTTVYLGACFCVLFLGTFILLFWSQPVRAALRLFHAIRLLWLISRARNDGSVILLPVIHNL